MKKSAPWKAPLEVVGSDSVETKADVWRGRRKVLSEVAIGAAFGAGFGFVSGLLLSVFTALATGLMGWTEGGQTLAVLATVGTVGVVGAVGGAIASALEEAEPRALKHSPRVLGQHAGAFHSLDSKLEELAGRVSVNPDLVGSVGRGVLDARAALVEVCEQYRSTVLEERASSAELERADALIQAEFEKAGRLLADATVALDEEERFAVEARMNPSLAADFEARLAGSPIDALSEGVQARRGALAEVRGEVGATGAPTALSA